MKSIEALKSFNWSINFESVRFKKGEVYQVEDDIAEMMVERDWAKWSRKKPKKTEGNKAVMSAPENKGVDGDKVALEPEVVAEIEAA